MAKAKKAGEVTKGVTARARRLVIGAIGRITARVAGARSAGSFLHQAEIIGLYEIEAAKLALERAPSPRVVELARSMLDDHTTSRHHLRSALRMRETRDGTLPDEVDARRRKMLDSLRAAPESEFDETYLDQQVLAHKEAAELMAGYRDRGENPQLRSLAAGTAPVVERHLRHVQELRMELAA